MFFMGSILESVWEDSLVICTLQIHQEAERDLPGETAECKDMLGIF